jgi:hypothetical protein
VTRQSHRTNLERPSPHHHRSSGSPRQPELAGNLSNDAPPHLAAGTVEIDNDVQCSCDFGCWECSDVTGEWQVRR